MIEIPKDIGGWSYPQQTHYTNFAFTNGLVMAIKPLVLTRGFLGVLYIASHLGCFQLF